MAIRIKVRVFLAFYSTSRESWNYSQSLSDKVLLVLTGVSRDTCRNENWFNYPKPPLATLFNKHLVNKLLTLNWFSFLYQQSTNYSEWVVT